MLLSWASSSAATTSLASAPTQLSSLQPSARWRWGTAHWRPPWLLSSRQLKALRRCRRLLPEAWVLPLQQLAELARPLVPGAREELRLLQQRASGVAGASEEALRASLAGRLLQPNRTQGQPRQFAHATDCDGCGQRAVGLRRCARCKQAQYCRCVAAALFCVWLAGLSGAALAWFGCAC